MLCSTLDHLVVAAPSLEEGICFVRRHLDVPMEAGGRHPRMGTHNALLRLGGSVYLEVIAVDPAAPAPTRPRWFDLDAPATKGPHLAGWVARTNAVQEASEVVGPALGSVARMSRGDLAWRITIPPDGSLPFGGVAPMLIEWAPGPHPAERLPDRGCSLARLEGSHPRADAINAILERIGFKDPFVAPGPLPRLVAHIKTPRGLRQLGLSGDTHG